MIFKYISINNYCKYRLQEIINDIKNNKEIGVIENIFDICNGSKYGFKFEDYWYYPLYEYLQPIYKSVDNYIVVDHYELTTYKYEFQFNDINVYDLIHQYQLIYLFIGLLFMIIIMSLLISIKHHKSIKSTD